MNSLSYNGHQIQQRKDGYVNGTQMCAANGKLIGHWFETKDYKRYVEAISRSIGIPIDLLTVSITTGKNENRGTWIHPKLAIKLGRWISVDFELWCDDHIKTLIETGTTSTREQDTPEWQQIRGKGKKSRRGWTDAIKDYLDRHPTMTEKEKRRIYSDVSDSLNLALFEKRAKDLVKYFGCDPKKLRDEFTEVEVRALMAMEDMAMFFVDTMDMHPLKAIHEACTRSLYQGRFAKAGLHPAQSDITK